MTRVALVEARVAAAVAAAIAATAATAPAGASAQSLEARVRGVDGTAVFQYPVRRGVEVCDNGIRTDGRRGKSWGRWRDGERNCSIEVAEVVLVVEGGSIRRLDLEPWEGPGSAPAGAMDLGRVDPAGAAAFLMATARSGRDGARAEEALVAATLAQDVEVWPDLLEIARDRSVRGDVRRAAVFWLGQAAADAATEGLGELATDEDEEQDVRDAAVFALSQRPDGAGVPALMELARTAREAKTRRSAMFWLSQSKDPRVLEFFAEVLASGGT